METQTTKKTWLITGRGEIPYSYKTWLDDYGISDFKLGYSALTFTGTIEQKTDVIRQLHKNERYFKVIGIEEVDPKEIYNR